MCIVLPFHHFSVDGVRVRKKRLAKNTPQKFSRVAAREETWERIAPCSVGAGRYFSSCS